MGQGRYQNRRNLPETYYCLSLSIYAPSRRFDYIAYNITHMAVALRETEPQVALAEITYVCPALTFGEQSRGISPLFTITTPSNEVPVYVDCRIHRGQHTAKADFSTAKRA